MKFRTEISMEATAYPIGYTKPVIMMGSCFTDYIGSRLKEALFHVTINPFGVSYNPLSMYSNLLKLLDKENYTVNDLDYYNNLWFSFDHYTLFSGSEKLKVLKDINNSFLIAKEKLTIASHLILTFGTAFIFEHKEKRKVVNNCHKIPAGEFSRRLLTVDEIVKCYEDLIQRIMQLNPEMKIDFTVSPVRHIKDGLRENQLSKATLLLAIEDILKKYPDRCTYFPAYEIMMDDLRDYRFYASDLVHPNDQAVDYIWEKFREYRINPECSGIMKEVSSLVKAQKHTLLHPESESSLVFKENTKNKRRDLEKKYPYLAWT